ncbi:MAG: S-layer homology domain-containing protein [Bacillota bacterium]
MSRLRIALGLTLILMLLAGTIPVAAATSGLKDVAGTKYENAVDSLFGIGVVTGTPSGYFEPNRFITRAEFATMVVKALGLTAEAQTVQNIKPSFPDVGDTWRWAWGFINVASNRGIIKGYPDGRFGPGDSVKYEEAITMLVRALSRDSEAQAAGAWPIGHIMVGTSLGLTANTDFTQGRAAIRGDLALMTRVAVFDVKDVNGKTLAGTIHAAKAIAAILVTAEQPTVGIGQKIKLTAIGYDLNGNKIAITPDWSVDGGGIINSSGEFAGTEAKTYRVTAKLGSLSGHLDITVGGRASRIALISDRSSLNANGQAKAIITVKTTDANGVMDTTYSGKLTFTVIGPGTLSTIEANAVNGQATVELTSTHVPGLIRVTAIAPDLAGAFIDVMSSTPTASQAVVSSDFSSVAADNSSVVVVTASLADSDGIAVANANNLITFSISNPLPFTVMTLDSDPNRPGIQVPASGGTARLHLMARSSPGTTYVTANADGVPSGGSVIVSSVVTGAPAALAFAERPVDTQVTNNVNNGMVVKVKLTDANGNTITGNSSALVTLTVTEKGTRLPNSTIGSVLTANCVQGVATFKVVNTEAEEVELSARTTIGGVTYYAPKTTGVFVPGAPAGVQVTSISPGVLAADGVHQAVVTARIYDTYGNFVPTANNEVTFTRTANRNAVTLPQLLAVRAVNGVATINVTAGTVPVGDGLSSGQGDVFNASGKKADGTPLIDLAETAGVGSNEVHSLIFGVPSSMRIIASNTTAGTPVTIKVELLDYAGRVVSSNNGTPVTLTILSGQGSLEKASVVTVNGAATFRLTTNVAQTALTVRATAGAIPSKQTTLTIAPGPVATVALKASHTSVAADGASRVTITAEQRDAYGNVIGPNTSIITLNPLATGVGTLSSTTLAPFSSVTFTASSLPSPVSLTAAGNIDASGNPVTGVNISTYLVGAANKLGIVLPINECVADGSATQVVRVRILDANGNWLSNYSAPAGTVTLTKPVTSTAIIIGNGAVTNGEAVFNVANTNAETVSYTATAPSLVQAMATGSFTAGPASHIVVSSSLNWISNDGISQTMISVRVVDTRGNTAKVNGTVTLSNSNTGSGTLNTSTVYVTNGISTTAVTLTSKTQVGWCTIGASSSDIAFQSATPPHVAAVVSVGTPVSSYAIVPSTYNPSRGVPFTVMITAVDAAGNPVLSANKVLTLSESGSAGLQMGGAYITGQTVVMSGGSALISVVGTGAIGASSYISVTDGVLFKTTSSPVILQ